MNTTGWIALGLGLTGCAGQAASALTPDWRVVGLYDATALQPLGAEGQVLAGAPWQPHPGMAQSCGPVKHPEGLGTFEAEAVAQGLTPALVVLLQAEGPAPRALGPHNLRVYLGEPAALTQDGASGGLLQPMVEPRQLRIELHWEGPTSERDTQGPTSEPDPNRLPDELELLSTQLRVELCLEHKTGRAWTGGSREQVRQAYLLDKPTASTTLELSGDRRYYLGQQQPVPALIGPPDACLARVNHNDPTRPMQDGALSGGAQARGQGSLDLIPTDVWGASLRICAESDAAHLYRLPLRLEGGEAAAPPASPQSAMPLEVDVALGAQRADHRVSLRWGPQKEVLLDQVPLYGAAAEPATEQSLVDLLAHVPLSYPLIRAPGEDEVVYTALILPAWQLNEQLLQAHPGRGAAQGPAALLRPGEVLDGVGWVMRHPEQLAVLLQPPRSEEGDDELPVQDWLNLSSGLVGEGWHPRSWGYTVGQALGREALLLPGAQAPTWALSRAARRADAQAVFLLSLSGLLLLSASGLLRVRDLWVGVPEERVTWWPGGRAARDPAEEAPTKGAEDPAKAAGKAQGGGATPAGEAAPAPAPAPAAEATP